MPFLLIIIGLIEYLTLMNGEQGSEIKGINNLSGWLSVVQIFIILNAFGWIRNLQLFYGLLGEKDKLIKDLKIADPSLYSFFIYYELAVSLVLIFFTVILVYYMFKRSKYFPMIFIIYLILDLVVEALVLVLFSSVAETPLIAKEKLIVGAAIAVLLIVYIKISKRVKVTFIH